ncbi:MerR family transcriptional regulator [Leeia sp. TBRC 13508]|uniref:MerR family transcriptional regulator n=1 Tax=Leeia speluncae TaxID=2884804 RepID=A0ABS8D4B8_9NEIS|nr:MerR family transcriptional regulator [Leeia speluncae]MCB6183054.1 MerR family transcriptional regulator [Leeia speluncae]
MTNIFISIGELSRLSGVSAYTLRFYEAEGVLKPAERGSNGHRRYLKADLLWLEFVLRLKQTGMPLSEIKQYAVLRAAGDDTLQPRLTMLELHREQLVRKIAELSTCAQVLEQKIQTYQDLLAKPTARKRKSSK